MCGDLTKQETWGSANVTDYALHSGPGVNETSDEKRNLPLSIISTTNSLCSSASLFLWLFPQGIVIGVKGGGVVLAGAGGQV